MSAPPPLTREFVISGSVTADTTGSITVGGKVKAEVCNTSSTVVNEPGTRFKLA